MEENTTTNNDDKITFFSDLDIDKIQKVKKKEKTLKKKLNIIRKLYHKTK